MNHCKDCYYWMAGENGQWGECQIAGGDAEGAPSETGTKAFAAAIDYSDAIFQTAFDFGCVMWEAEPKEMPF